VGRAVRGPSEASALSVLIEGQDGVSLVFHRHLCPRLGYGLVVAKQIGPFLGQPLQCRMALGVHLQINAFRVLLPVVIGEKIDRECLLDGRAMVAALAADALEGHVASHHPQGAALLHIVRQEL